MRFSIKRHRFYLCLLFICLFTGILASTPGQASVKGKRLSLEFLDDRLSLTAEKAPLKTILMKIHENTKLGYEIPKNYLELLISVSFQSLPLEKGIQRILHRLNYACVFDHNGKLTKVIILLRADKSQESFSNKRALNEKLPIEKTFQTVSTPTAEDLVAAMNAGEITPPREIEDYLKAMETVSASEAQDMMKHIRITPLEQGGQEHAGETGPSLEELQRIVENMPEGL